MDEIRIMQLGAQGFCCSQILMLLTLEDMAEENIPLVRAMAGLCEGSGAGELCGVASGATCVLALYTAKGLADEQALPLLPLITGQFMDWFREYSTPWGGMRCEEILAAQGGQRPEVCATIMTQARATLLGLLAEHGIDPSMPRSDHG
ncbi:MAG: DVU_1555 family C-GCAxxG-C-C protein [Desulfobulbus sp.]|jgi:hypothetical protein